MNMNEPDFTEGKIIPTLICFAGPVYMICRRIREQQYAQYQEYNIDEKKQYR